MDPKFCEHCGSASPPRDRTPSTARLLAGSRRVASRPVKTTAPPVAASCHPSTGGPPPLPPARVPRPPDDLPAYRQAAVHKETGDPTGRLVASLLVRRHVGLQVPPLRHLPHRQPKTLTC